MTIIGIRFTTAGRIYYFDPDGAELKAGDAAIVETARGIEYGKVVLANRDVPEDEIVQPLKKIIRKADESDYEKHMDNKRRAHDAVSVWHEKVKSHNLPMKLIDVELSFDAAKIIFYFTADGRIDFRELVKELAGVFRMRIELRQVGVRDEAKMLNGIGICGRALCCATFLSEFQPVSIKMAKEQSLSLNPIKISGICGRLMCCLKYEQDVYEELNRKMPNIGDMVTTKDGRGEVLSTSVLKQTVRVAVRKRETDIPNIQNYSVKDIKLVPAKRGKDEAEQSAEATKAIKEILD